MSNEFHDPQEPARQLPAHAMFNAVDGGDEPLAPAPGRKVPTTHITAAFVAIVGGASIFAMRQMGMKSGMDFDARPIAFESEYSPEDHARFQRVLAELEMSDMLVQIPPEHAGSNPFFLGIEREDPNAGRQADAAERERQRQQEQARRAAEARLAQIKGALDRLRLGTIVTGRVPVATINDEIVRVGDVVDEMFTVVEIQPSAVTLEADGVRYTITPQSHGPGAGR